MKKLIALLMFVGLFGSSVYAEAVVVKKAPDVSAVSIQQSTAELITLITGMIKQAKDFAIQEAPDAIRQLLTYDFIDVVSSIVGMGIVFIILLLLSIHLCKKHKDKGLNDKNYIHQLDWHDGGTGLNVARWFSMCATYAFGIVFVLVLLCSVSKMIQIKATPTAYLINKYVSSGK